MHTFTRHYLLIIPPFDATECQQPTSSGYKT